MIKRIDIKEFRECGYLQELNRLFLHPLGMALEVIIEEDGTHRLGGIWDYRDEPEGMFFNWDRMDHQVIWSRACQVGHEFKAKTQARALTGETFGLDLEGDIQIQDLP